MPLHLGGQRIARLHRGATPIARAYRGAVKVYENAAAGYVANAVHFDGTNDYLTRGADPTGLSDGQEGTISLWVRFSGGDGTAQQILHRGTSNNDAAPRVSRAAANTITVQLRDSSAGILLQIQPAGAYTVASGWLHILAAWDLGVPEGYLYINDANADPGGSTVNSGTVDYTKGNLSIGALTDGNQKLNGDLADVWFHAAFIDISVEANRRKFISAAGKPVSLGANGELPLGASPLIFLSGATGAWHTNKGTGGGLTLNGALTDAADSPSS